MNMVATIFVLSFMQLEHPLLLDCIMEALDSNAENYCNDESIERDWVVKACQHADVYFNLLCTVGDCTKLRLTPHDDVVYEAFQEQFTDLTVEVVSDDLLKSADAKTKWRAFCMQFENVVDNYNFGTLLRLDCRQDYSQANTTLVPRVQFLALEIARNRRGLNSGLKERYSSSGKSDDKDSASC